MPDGKSPFHRGEKQIQARLGIQDKMEDLGRRVIRDSMPEQHQEFFAQLPLLIVGTADECGRPWASALTGKPGFVRARDPQTLEVTAQPVYGDPLGKGLNHGAHIGVLGLEFETRRRNRANGKIVRTSEGAFEIRVAQSFGNCPKYIQARQHQFSDDNVENQEKKW